MTREASFSQSDARARFTALLLVADGSIDVAEAALCIAAEHTPVDMEGCCAQLAELAERARPDLEQVGVTRDYVVPHGSSWIVVNTPARGLLYGASGCNP